MTSGNNFHKDMERQLIARDKFITPLYYEMYGKDRVVLLDDTEDKTEHRFLQKAGVDTLIQKSNKKWDIIGVDEKLDFHPFKKKRENFFLEFMSCSLPGKETQGWMTKDTVCDVLLYCFIDQGLSGCQAYFFDFHDLKRWYEGNADKYKVATGNNVTYPMGSLIPIEVLTKEVEQVKQPYIIKEN